MNENKPIVSIGNVAVYDPFRAQLVELRELNLKTVFDYEDEAGNKGARSYIHKLRLTKGTVDRARVEEKAASLEYGRLVDSQAKEIISELEGMIEVHAKPIREIEEREKERIAALDLELRTIIEPGQSAADGWIEVEVVTLQSWLSGIEVIEITEEKWGDRTESVAAYRQTSIAHIREAIAKHEAHDAEQAELEALRKREAERVKADAEAGLREEEEERQAHAKAEADAREKVEAERRELELKLKAEQAERAKAEAEQRAAQAEKEAIERQAREAAEKKIAEEDAAKAREADRTHRGKINSAAAKALHKGGLGEEAAKQAVRLIAEGSVPHVSIAY